MYHIQKIVELINVKIRGMYPFLFEEFIKGNINQFTHVSLRDACDLVKRDRVLRIMRLTNE